MKKIIGKIMKRTMVRCSDYEFYRILLPWKCIFSRNRNFIVGELEKMHPRFSGNCCYDTKYCVEKKKLLAEVVVMEKSSLAQYKNCGGELYLENMKRRSVFSLRNRILRFVSLVLIVIAGILSFRIAKSFMTGNASPDVYASLLMEDDADGLCTQNLSDEKICISEDEKVLSSVFYSVSSHGGKISSFSYNKTDSISAGKSGVCTFSIYGCNCEDVANARCCVVSFKDNEPHFEMVLPFKNVDFVSSVNDEQKISEDEEIAAVVSIRKKLREIGAVFESEHNGNDEAEFSFFAERKILYSCLKIVGLEAENAAWSEKIISISEKGGMCKVKLCFSKNKIRYDFSPLLLVSQYAYLFGSELKLEPKKTGLFGSEVKKSVEKCGELFPLKNKIGEIKKKDGSILVCYRNSEGRMAFEKKEAANAGL